jgi:hypothetical protein
MAKNGRKRSSPPRERINDMMNSRSAKVRFEDGIHKGKSTWEMAYNSDPDQPAILKMSYPDGSLLLPEQITALEQVDSRSGWQDPRTVLKTAAISGASLLIGGIAVEHLLNLPGISEAGEALKEAIEKLSLTGVALETALNGSPAVEEALKAFFEQFPNDTSTILAIVAGSGAIMAPSVYAGYKLSQRRIRLLIRLDSGDQFTVVTPEFTAAFLLGAFKTAEAGVASPAETPAEAETPA